MIRAIINLYILLLIVNAILSYVPSWRYNVWVVRIRKTADLTLNPVRKYMPLDLAFDVSPVVVILALKLLEVLW